MFILLLLEDTDLDDDRGRLAVAASGVSFFVDFVLDDLEEKMN